MTTAKKETAKKAAESREPKSIHLKDVSEWTTINNRQVAVDDEITVTAPLILDGCNLVFLNDEKKQSYGRIIMKNSKLQLKNCVIVWNNERDSNKSLIRLYNSALSLKKTAVKTPGRFIKSDSLSKIKFSDSEFKELGDGFIKGNGSKDGENLDITIDNCIFDGSSADGGEGALFELTHLKRLLIEESHFEKINLPILRIGLYSTRRTIEISDTQFKDCLPAKHLLDISGGYGTELKINRCRFKNCSSLKFADDPIEITDSVFEDCRAQCGAGKGMFLDEIRGGAILFDSYDSGRIENCTFKNCTASCENGGLLGKMEETIAALGEQMEKQMKGEIDGEEKRDKEKRKYGEGGAIYIEINPYHNKDLIIKNCEFTECEAGEKGGAIIVNQDSKTKKPPVVIENCRFKDCRAAEGSAVHARSMVTGTFKWNTEEKPFLSAEIRNAEYDNCVSYPAENDGEIYDADRVSLAEFTDNAGHIISIVADLAQSLIKGKGDVSREREKIGTAIEELEEQLFDLADKDPAEFEAKMKELERLEQKYEGLEAVDEIKNDFKELLKDLGSF